MVSGNGVVEGVSWRAWTLESSEAVEENVRDGGGKRYENGGRGDFDLVVQREALGIWIDRPATKKGKARQVGREKREGEGGEGEEEEEGDERGFLQK